MASKNYYLIKHFDQSVTPALKGSCAYHAALFTGKKRIMRKIQEHVSSE
jgi:hypothetical protein